MPSLTSILILVAAFVLFILILLAWPGGGSPDPSDGIVTTWLGSDCATGINDQITELKDPANQRVLPLLVDALDNGPSPGAVARTVEAARVRFELIQLRLTAGETFGLQQTDADAVRNWPLTDHLNYVRDAFVRTHRRRAAFGLGQLGTAAALDALRVHARRPNSPVRDAAIAALRGR